jgi:hypothetical protein
MEGISNGGAILAEYRSPMAGILFPIIFRTSWTPFPVTLLRIQELIKKIQEISPYYFFW